MTQRVRASKPFLLAGKIFCDAISICDSCPSSCRTETWRCKCLDWRSHAIFIQSLLKGTSKLCGISRRCLRCEHYTVLLHALYISPQKYMTFSFFWFVFFFCFVLSSLFTVVTLPFSFFAFFYQVFVFFKKKLKVIEPWKLN